MMPKDQRDVMQAFYRLTEAAEAYVNRSPRVKRIQEQRSALLDAIANAQLVLSVHRLPKDSESSSRSPKTHQQTAALEKEVKDARAELAELERSLRPIAPELDAIQARAQKAKGLLENALAKQEAGKGRDAA